MKARTYDHALRWHVPSRTVVGKDYLVELDAYGFNGECQCKNFNIECRPLLERGISPAEAVKGGLVPDRPEKRVEDALRCHHILDAFVELGEEFARVVVAAEKMQRERIHAPTKNAAPSDDPT